MDKLEGLELRKAALTAAGWMSKYSGTLVAWQHAPAVELSVDAALRWLKLPRYHSWELYPMQSEPPYIKDDRSTATIYNLLNGDDVACGEDESLPVAMCQAYLQHKAGA